MVRKSTQEAYLLPAHSSSGLENEKCYSVRRHAGLQSIIASHESDAGQGCSNFSLTSTAANTAPRPLSDDWVPCFGGHMHRHLDVVLNRGATINAAATRRSVLYK